MELRKVSFVLLVLSGGLQMGSCFNLNQSLPWLSGREQAIIRRSDDKGNSSHWSGPIHNELEALLNVNKSSKIHKRVALTVARVLASRVKNIISQYSYSFDSQKRNTSNALNLYTKLKAEKKEHFNSMKHSEKYQTSSQNSSNKEKQSNFLQESQGGSKNLFDIDLLTKTIVNISRFMKRVGLIDECSEQVQNSISKVVWKLVDFLLVREDGPGTVTQWMYKQWKKIINKLNSPNKINNKFEDRSNCDKNYPRQHQPSEQQIRNLIQILDVDLIRYFAARIEQITQKFQSDNTKNKSFFSNSSTIFCSKLDQPNGYNITECRDDFQKLLQASFAEEYFSDKEHGSQARTKRNVRLQIIDPRRTALETFQSRNGYDHDQNYLIDNSEYVVMQHTRHEDLSALYPLKVIFHVGVYGILGLLTYVIYMMPRHGPDGPKGEEGYYGYKGYHGIKGIRGYPGRPGKKGEPGLKGLLGFRGHKGRKGCTIDGKKGKRGFDGYHGAKGRQGPVGETGDRGDKGKIGPPGLRGRVGKTGIPGELYYNKVHKGHHDKGHHHKGHHGSHHSSHHGRQAITNKDTLTTLSDSVAAGNENDFLKVMTEHSQTISKKPTTDDSNDDHQKESFSELDGFWKGCPNCPGFKEAYKNILSGNKNSEEIQHIASSYVNRYKAWLHKQKSVTTSGRWELKLEPVVESQPTLANLTETNKPVGPPNETKQISTNLQKMVEEKVEKFVQKDIEEKTNEAMENIEDDFYASYEEDDSIYETLRKRRRLSRKRRSRSHEIKHFDATEGIYNEEFQKSDYRCKVEESEEEEKVIRTYEITQKKSFPKKDKKHRKRRAVLKEPESIISTQDLSQGVHLSARSLQNSADFLTNFTPKQPMIEHQADAASALFHSLNKLWRERLNREGCLKCHLFDILEQQPVSSLDHFIIAGFSHLLGASESLQLLDDVREGKKRGIKMRCRRRKNTCDLERSASFLSTSQSIPNYNK